MDRISRLRRSENMARIKGKDTKPELWVRSFIHRAGLRFRLHDKSLPGKPDLVFKRHRKVVFVHGCFWHQHRNCPLAVVPGSNVDFWRAKLSGNAARDLRVRRRLGRLGWRVLVLWECEIEHELRAARKINRFFSNSKPAARPERRKPPA